MMETTWMLISKLIISFLQSLVLKSPLFQTEIYFGVRGNPKTLSCKISDQIVKIEVFLILILFLF